jgi:hypothetical protein
MVARSRTEAEPLGPSRPTWVRYGTEHVKSDDVIVK